MQQGIKISVWKARRRKDAAQVLTSPHTSVSKLWTHRLGLCWWHFLKPFSYPERSGLHCFLLLSGPGPVHFWGCWGRETAQPACFAWHKDQKHGYCYFLKAVNGSGDPFPDWLKHPSGPWWDKGKPSLYRLPCNLRKAHFMVPTNNKTTSGFVCYCWERKSFSDSILFTFYLSFD